MRNRLKELIVKKAADENRKVREVRVEIMGILGVTKQGLNNIESKEISKGMDKWFKLQEYFKLASLNGLFNENLPEK